MRKSRIAIITLMILVLTIIVPMQIHASTPEGLIEQAEKELTETLGILDKAGSGADDVQLKSIGAQLNEALRLVEEAKQHMSEGKMTEANTSAEEALSLIKRAKSEAESTLEASSQRAFQTLVLSWSLAPVTSLLTALFTARGYEWYVKRERRKLLNMAITRKRKKEKD